MWVLTCRSASDAARVGCHDNQASRDDTTTTMMTSGRDEQREKENRLLLVNMKQNGRGCTIAIYIIF